MKRIRGTRRLRPRPDLALEHKLQGQLRRARAADLIQRIEAAILAAAAERGSQHLCRLAEERRTRRSGRNC